MGTTFTKDFNSTYEVFVQYIYFKMSVTYLVKLNTKWDNWYCFEVLWHVPGTSRHPNNNFK